MYYVIWWLQPSATPQNYPSFYLTQNQTWRPHTTNWLGSRLLKQKCSHYKLGDFLPRPTSSQKKKNREAVTSKKRTMNEVVHAGLFHWKKYWLIPQICLLLTCHPEGVLFWGKARKSTDGEKGKQISLLLKPMSKNWPPKNSWATDHVPYWA